MYGEYTVGGEKHTYVVQGGKTYEVKVEEHKADPEKAARLKKEYEVVESQYSALTMSDYGKGFSEDDPRRALKAFLDKHPYLALRHQTAVDEEEAGSGKVVGYEEDRAKP